MSHLQFSQILKSLRKENNVTQEELAAYLHVTRSTIAGYESRNKQPDFEKLVLIADFFHVTIDYLITGENPIASKLYAMEQLTGQQLETMMTETFRTLSYFSKYKLLEYAQLLKLYENIENQ